MAQSRAFFFEDPSFVSLANFLWILAVGFSAIVCRAEAFFFLSCKSYMELLKITVYSWSAFLILTLLRLHGSKPQYVDSLAAVLFGWTGFASMWFQEIGF